MSLLGVSAFPLNGVRSQNCKIKIWIMWAVRYFCGIFVSKIVSPETIEGSRPVTMPQVLMVLHLILNFTRVSSQ